MASSAPLESLLPSLARLTIGKKDPPADTGTLAVRPRMTAQERAEERRLVNEERQKRIRDDNIMDLRLRQGLIETKQLTEFSLLDAEFASKFKETMQMLPTEYQLPVEIAKEWAQLEGYPPFWHELVVQDSGTPRFESEENRVAANAMFLRNVFKTAGTALAFVSTEKNVWQVPNLAKRIGMTDTFRTTYDHSSIEQSKLSFSKAVVEKIAQRMLSKIVKGEEYDATNPVRRDEKITLQPTVQMANADPSRPAREFGIDKIQIKLSQNDGSREPRYSKAYRQFANKGDPVVSYPRFAGYSVFPQQFKDYCDVDAYVLPKKEPVFPSELTTYYSYYLNGVGKAIRVVNHASHAVPVPRLSSAAIRSAAEICNRDVDYFKLTVLEWEDILAQYIRARSPNVDLKDMLFAGQEEAYDIDPQFLAPGMMYKNDIPPGIDTNEVYYHMEIRIVWKNGQKAKDNPTIEANTNTLSKKPSAAALPHWAEKFATIKEDSQNTWSLFLTYIFRQKVFTFEFAINPEESDHGVVAMIVKSQDSSWPCIEVDVMQRQMYIQSLFYLVDNKANCNIGWFDDASSGYGMAALRVLQDAAMYLNVPMCLQDAAYTPDREPGTPDANGNIFYIARSKFSTQPRISTLTATLLITRGYGLYEGEGFFPANTTLPESANRERKYAEERLAYHHMLVTTPIMDLDDAVQRYFQADVFDWDAYPVDEEADSPWLLETMAKEKIENARDLKEWFRKELRAVYDAGMSLRNIALKMNNGEFSTKDASKIIVEMGERFIRLTIRLINTAGDKRSRTYLADTLRMNFYDDPTGGEGVKMHYVVVPNENNPGGPPVVATRRVEGVNEYRYVKSQLGRESDSAFMYTQ